MYNIKIYNRLGTVLLKTLNLEKVKSNFSYSEVMNFGLQDFSFDYLSENEIIDGNLLLQERNLVKLYQKGQLVYTGYILDIAQNQNSDGLYYSVTTSGLATLLSKLYYTGPKNAVNFNPTTVVEECINILNTRMGYNINTDQIQQYPTSWGWGFEDSLNCLQALNKALENASDWMFYLDENNNAIFRPISEGEQQFLTFGVDLESIALDTDTTGIINRYYMKYGDPISNTVVVEDATSIAQAGLSEALYTSKYLLTQADAIATGNSLLQKTGITKKIKLVANSKIKKINIGDNLSIRDTKIEIKLEIIKKIKYSMDKITIECAEYESLEQYLNNN